MTCSAFNASVSQPSTLHLLDYWKPIPGFDGRYSVSQAGYVRSESRTIELKDGRKKSWRERQLSARLVQGYPMVNLMKQGKVHYRKVHRLVMEAFVGPCPTGKEVCHGNGWRADCRLSNLRYGTHQENGRDMSLHGRVSHEANGRAVLTADAVRSIRACADSRTQISQALEHGVSKSLISEILRDKCWRGISKNGNATDWR